MDLSQRVKNILHTPQSEWDVIAGEESTIHSLYTSYAIPLSLISAVCGFIDGAFIAPMRTGIFKPQHTHTIEYWIVFCSLSWFLKLCGLYLSAYFVDLLAPSFDSTRNRLNALKLVVYASTGLWVGGILRIIPIAGIIGMLAGVVYSIYLFYTGLPKLMGTPPQKTVGYMVMSALIQWGIIAIILAVVLIFAALVIVASKTVNQIAMP